MNCSQDNFLSLQLMFWNWCIVILLNNPFPPILSEEGRGREGEKPMQILTVLDTFWRMWLKEEYINRE